MMTAKVNPFALVRAADYTDVQINALWVELGASVINTVIEPTSGISKYILGGRGSGKTHLLRYYSYQVSRLRMEAKSGLSVLETQKFLAVFLRATALDAARFEASTELSIKWQQLFGVYLELRLAEGLLDALCDIKKTTPHTQFNDAAFIASISESVVDRSVSKLQSIEEFRIWLVDEKRKIDDAINNSAFSGVLDVRVPFSIGALCLPLKKAIGAWHPSFDQFPLIYLIDEVENFSDSQQQVVNSLIRYGEGMATFRVTGRLYGRKTLATIGGGEENREGAEFKTTNLDEILKTNAKYADFAKRFVMRRLGIAYAGGFTNAHKDPSSFFEDIHSEHFYTNALTHLRIETGDEIFRNFSEALRGAAHRKFSAEDVAGIINILTTGFPSIIARLNTLQFCKKYSEKKNPFNLAEKIKSDAQRFISGEEQKGSYANSYGHYKNDLFAQLCRDSKKQNDVPYAGFETFVLMSSGNPRNLLIILSRAYEIASFKEVDFINGPPLSVSMQTQAAIEAAHFMFERDTNYGGLSDQAKIAVERLAILLRTARYSLNIPEVSPLAISFSDDQLSIKARSVLAAALNFSLLFEVKDGRPDRNSHRVNRKVQLNPLLSPKWGLPVARRGDLSLSDEMVQAILDPACGKEFDLLLKHSHQRWNSPFNFAGYSIGQADLFKND